jgi:Domain of unknown function (DUF4157)
VALISELVERKRGGEPSRSPGPSRSRPVGSSVAQRCVQTGHAGCDCPEPRLRVQAVVRVGPASDRYEQEAEALAARISSAVGGPVAAEPTGAPLAVSRLGTGPALPAGTTVEGRLDHGGGRPLSEATRRFLEPRFGSDFGAVRVHEDDRAHGLADRLHARAFTSGTDIWLGAGENQADRRLMAHELTHVLQQGGGAGAGTVQRDCSDPTFCTPYATPAEAASTEARLRSYYLPVEETKFGANSRALYESYLSRHPGDSLAPVEFNDPNSDVVQSFASSRDTDNDQDAIIDLIGARLTRSPAPLADYVPTTMSVENFVTRAELDDRPINYSNPFSIAGHIAGGIGSSDAGPDYRKIQWGNATLERVPLVGGIGYTSVETTLHYEVFDAVDFCPGDCGSLAEQLITIPMSRLESSGEAYDVPFRVTFVPESRSKRFWFS